MIRGTKIPLNFPVAGAQQLSGPNPSRVGIICCPPSASTYYITFGDNQVNNEGIRFASGAYGPWTLLFDKPNPFITAPIWVQSQAAALATFYELVEVPD